MSDVVNTRLPGAFTKQYTVQNVPALSRAKELLPGSDMSFNFKGDILQAQRKAEADGEDEFTKVALLGAQLVNLLLPIPRGSAFPSYRLAPLSRKTMGTNVECQYPTGCGTEGRRQTGSSCLRLLEVCARCCV